MVKPWCFFHGWGLGGFVWADAAASLPQAQVFDRGYFGPGQPLALPQGRAVCHSQGLHVLLQQDLTHVQELVVINGFLDFTPQRRAITAMAARLKGDPHGLLQDFYQQTCSPAPCLWQPLAPTDPALLMADLLALLEPPDLTKLPQCLRIWLVWGGQDAVLKPRQQAALTAALPQAQPITLPQAGHWVSWATLFPLLEAI